MTILITLTTVGIDCSTFDIYSNVDGFLSAFETDVPKGSLLTGFSSANTPDGTTVIRVKAKGVCTNYIDITLPTITTTTSTTTSMCTLVINSTVTTNPTNINEDDGTVTINFSGGTDVVNYTLNTIPQGTTTSPLVINGLVAENTYTVVLTDANNCSVSTEFTIGQSSFTFDADYAVLTYKFSDATDLDTRSRIVEPDINMNNYLGFGAGQCFPNDLSWSKTNIPTTAVIDWSGDNIGTGYESILVDIQKLKALKPDMKNFVVDLRAAWFNAGGPMGVLPVEVKAMFYKGGTMLKSQPVTNPLSYEYTNPTATSSLQVTSDSKVINTRYQDDGGVRLQRLAVFKYNVVTKVGSFDINDTTTPAL